MKINKMLVCLLLIIIIYDQTFCQNSILIVPGHGGSSSKAIEVPPLASLTSVPNFDIDDRELSLTIDMDSTEILQGKSFTLTLTIENHSDKSRKIDKASICPNYYNFQTQEETGINIGQLFEYYYIKPKSKLIIPITHTFLYDYSSKNKKFTHNSAYWKPGQYKVTMHLDDSFFHIESNSIVIDIKPLKEQEKRQFDQLVELAHIKDSREIQKILENLEENFEIQKSIYKEEILGRLRIKLDRTKKQDQPYIQKLEIESFKLNPNSALALGVYQKALKDKERNPTLLDILNNILNKQKPGKKYKLEQMIESQQFDIRKEGLDE